MLFSIAEGRNLNVFFQDDRVNAHVVWRDPKRGIFPRRLQICFPEGNCGVGVDLSGTVDFEEAVASWGEPGGRRGAEVRLTVCGAVEIGEACLDTLRSLRDWKQPEAHLRRRELRRAAGLAEPAWTAAEDRSTWALHTPGLANRWPMVLEMVVPPGVSVTVTPPGLRLEGPVEPWSLVVRGGHCHPPLHPLGEARLLSAPAQSRLAGLEPGAPRQRALLSLRNLTFLAFEEKLLAGSWRFLTYFGRDSLLTSLLLGPTASMAFHRAALESVIARLSQGGQVAHEEDIGEQAVYRRREVNPQLTDPSRAGDPVYDYKMVDDDFLLLPALHALSLHPEAQGWWPEFRSRHQGALEANIRWCLGRLGNLVGLDHDVVGDWRDSHWGLGGGFYPNSVNVGLVPAFLKALDWYGEGPQEGRVSRDFWAQVPHRFSVRLSEGEVRTRLRGFLAAAPLSQAERTWCLSRDLGGVSIDQWLEGGGRVPRLENGLEFPALSLDREGRPIEVMHSDVSFRLFLAEPDAGELGAILTLLELPYPLGLAHPVGFLAANAALSGRPDLWTKLGRQGYHGAVVWSWQDAMVILGLRRQLRRPGLGPETRGRLQRLVDQAHRQRTLAGDLVSSELWSWRIVDGEAQPAAYGAAETDETESNAIQLWSSAVLALTLGDRAD